MRQDFANDASGGKQNLSRCTIQHFCHGFGTFAHCLNTSRPSECIGIAGIDQNGAGTASGDDGATPIHGCRGSGGLGGDTSNGGWCSKRHEHDIRAVLVFHASRRHRQPHPSHC